MIKLSNRARREIYAQLDDILATARERHARLDAAVNTARSLFTRYLARHEAIVASARVTAIEDAYYALGLCPHVPRCPAADASDHDAAKVLADHHDQGWVLLCNGVIVYDDTGETLPDGRTVAPHRPDAPHARAGARA